VGPQAAKAIAMRPAAAKISFFIAIIVFEIYLSGCKGNNLSPKMMQN
jgi:hypothetical protein